MGETRFLKSAIPVKVGRACFCNSASSKNQMGHMAAIVSPPENVRQVGNLPYGTEFSVRGGCAVKRMNNSLENVRQVGNLPNGAELSPVSGAHASAFRVHALNLNASETALHLDKSKKKMIGYIRLAPGPVEIKLTRARHTKNRFLE
jgi:hypothetical protein